MPSQSGPVRTGWAMLFHRAAMCGNRLEHHVAPRHEYISLRPISIFRGSCDAAPPHRGPREKPCTRQVFSKKSNPCAIQSATTHVTMGNIPCMRATPVKTCDIPQTDVIAPKTCVAAAQSVHDSFNSCDCEVPDRSHEHLPEPGRGSRLMHARPVARKSVHPYDKRQRYRDRLHGVRGRRNLPRPLRVPCHPDHARHGERFHR